ncbi:MAG: acetylxylan esterase [Gemmatimonadota bacterium]
MPWYDLPLAKLREHTAGSAEPPGLDDWWAARLAAARAAAAPVTLTEYEPGAYGPLRVYDAEFSGAGGDRIRGWYLLPPGSPAPDAGAGPAAVVVKFVGYGGGRGLPVEHALLPAAGFATFVMDVRGQGGRWTVGATGDPAAGAGPELSTVMTRGLASPEDYYYTRLFTDAVRAAETAAGLAAPGARLAVAGASQGGGLALATAALLGGAVAVCHADVPFLCDIGRAVTLAPKAPYTEVAEFLANHTGLVDAALNTLCYVDCALLASRITAECLLSVGLMDDICPPSTVFAAYNAIRSGKDIAVHPFGVHVVPGSHTQRQLAHLRQHLTGG